ncbi:MAG: hypothetical protein ACD_20C00120G0002 [uncultured bacterium]|nr:MAG: hypothetical protein ACD_20C00120G0002 [uncultured bacterium]
MAFPIIGAILGVVSALGKSGASKGVAKAASSAAGGLAKTAGSESGSIFSKLLDPIGLLGGGAKEGGGGILGGLLNILS